MQENITNKASLLAEQLYCILKERGLIISVAESFTAGRVTSQIISVPGASAVFHEGIVAYSNLAKMLRLGVSEDTLKAFGAVSRECCKEMIQGLFNLGKCDVAIATTGIAGPKPDGTNKPVGLCYIGVGTKKDIKVYEYHLDGDREQITASAVSAALKNAVDLLTELG